MTKMASDFHDPFTESKIDFIFLKMVCCKNIGLGEQLDIF